MRKIILVGKKDGKEIHINDAKRGAGCGCVCPSCSAPLIARQGDENIWHFAHSQKTDCDYGETLLHFNSKEILSQHTSIRTEENGWFQYDTCLKEYKIADMRVDALLINSSANKKLVVEIVNRYNLSDEKIERLNNLGYDVLEIDLSGYEDELAEDVHKKILIEDYDEKTPFMADYTVAIAEGNSNNGLGACWSDYIFYRLYCIYLFFGGEKRSQFRI